MNRIINADCVDGLRSLEAGSVALTVTSPPYDRVRDFAPFDFEALAKELWQVTAEGGVVVWVVGDQIVKGSESGTSFRQALFFKELGFRLHHTMVFEPSGTMASRTFPRYGLAIQYMFVLSKGKPRTVHLIEDKLNKCVGGGGHRGTRWKSRVKGKPVRKWGLRGPIWRKSVGLWKTTKDQYAFEHPALMPEVLARDHILSWSNPGDLVLDPFAGAGTTLKMAALLGRRFIGVEIDPKWCALAERRVRKAILGAVL
jgi:site-specific DNA-methyltransferase (adenine-specific)